MKKTLNNIINIFDKTKSLSDISVSTKAYNLQEIYKHRLKIIRYSSQLISLLALIPSEDEKNKLFSISSFDDKKINLNIDEYLKSSNKHTLKLPNEEINNELIDDYLTVIGELIQGLYQLHYEKYKLDYKGDNDRNK